MKMNQNLRDFSDRHFVVWFMHRESETFTRYEDASRYVKSLVRVCKDAGMGRYNGLAINQYIELYSRPNNPVRR
jgi:hypothetical protein